MRSQVKTNQENLLWFLPSRRKARYSFDLRYSLFQKVYDSIERIKPKVRRDRWP